jgi:hypothetical protein
LISLTGVLGLGVVFLTIALIIILRMLGKDREKPAFRRIAAFDELKKSIGLAVENGSRIHVTLGKSSLTQPTIPQLWRVCPHWIASPRSAASATSRQWRRAAMAD